MAGSSMRNSLHRRNHKERSQLVGRERLGLLEKHKDYVLRAKDYNSKKARVKRLQEKAAMRNKDEFYFGMVNKKTENGIQYESRGNVAMPDELVKVLKTQDVGYVRTVRASELSVCLFSSYLGLFCHSTTAADSESFANPSYWFIMWYLYCLSLDVFICLAMGIKQNIERLKAQLGSLADLIPSVNSQEEETELDEKIKELEESTLKKSGLLEERPVKGKGKGKAVPRKIVFKDTLNEVHNYTPSSINSSSSQPGPSTFASSSTSFLSGSTPSLSSSAPPPDLGWITPVSKANKKKAKQVASADPATQAAEAEQEARARTIAAKKHKLALLRNLSTHLIRESALKHAEHEMNLQRNLMGKGSKKKISSGGREEIVELDGDEEEDDERGGKKGEWKSRVFKWKAERRR